MGNKSNVADPDQLTIKQRKFCDELTSGNSPTMTAAYAAAYDVVLDNPKAKRRASREASRLAKHPGCESYMERARSAVAAQRSRRDLGTREMVKRKLWEEAEGADRSSDRIAALRLLGLEASMFTERVEVTDDASKLSDTEVIAEIEAALVELTAVAVDASGCIDVGSSEVDASQDLTIPSSVSSVDKLTTHSAVSPELVMECVDADAE